MLRLSSYSTHAPTNRNENEDKIKLAMQNRSRKCVNENNLPFVVVRSWEMI